MGSTTARECLATLNWTVPFPGSAATHYELDFGLALHPILDPYGLVVLTVSAGALTVASQSSKLSGSALSYLLAIFRSALAALRCPLNTFRISQIGRNVNRYIIFF